MRVLFADDERCRRDFLQRLVEQNQDMQVSGIAVDTEGPAEREAPDEPLQFTTLSVEEGKKVPAVVEPEQWMQLRPDKEVIPLAW